MNNILDYYKVTYNELGKVDAINKIHDGASLIFYPDTKTFDENNYLTQELRILEDEYGELDLSDRPIEPETLEQVKLAKVAEIVAEAARRQDALVADYSSAERDSWDKKIEESKKFLETKNLADVQYLPVEAVAMTGAQTNEEILAATELLAAKVLEKADQLFIASSTISGTRARLYELIMASNDIEFIKNIVFE